MIRGTEYIVCEIVGNNDCLENFILALTHSIVIRLKGTLPDILVNCTMHSFTTLLRTPCEEQVLRHTLRTVSLNELQ